VGFSNQALASELESWALCLAQPTRALFQSQFIRVSIGACENRLTRFSIEYDNYNYASHHIVLPGIHANSTQSPLATFCREKQPEKRVLLGLGTRSVEESKREHKMNMMRRLAAIDIDKKLKQ
jgi:hypothetical protein